MRWVSLPLLAFLTPLQTGSGWSVIPDYTKQDPTYKHIARLKTSNKIHTFSLLYQSIWYPVVVEETTKNKTVVVSGVCYVCVCSV